MKIARMASGFIVLIWVFIVVLLGTVLMLGYRRNSADLEQLMANEADRLIEITTVSAEAAIHSLDEVEHLTEERLLDNARLIELMNHLNQLPADTLTAITHRNNLHMIDILGPDGSSKLRGGANADSGEVVMHTDSVERVLHGGQEEAVIGFMEDRYYRDQQYGVVIGRRQGGAVVVNADSDRMLEFRRSVGLGSVFAEIGDQQGIRYIALQDTLGIVAASRGIDGMSRIYGDAFLEQADSRRIRVSRYLPDGNGRVYEVVNPLVVDNVYLGLIRVGLETDTIDGIRSRARIQFTILFIAAMLSGMFVLIYLVLRQNYMILNVEHDRMLADVRRMEADARLMERLTSMGRLAGGVAHEIRNPLNAVSIIAQRLKTEFTPSSDAEEYRNLLATIGREVTRISGIVENFLRYARPPKLALSEVELSVVLKDAAEIMEQHASGRNINIRVTVDERLRCRCDYDQLKQAVMNVILNAIEAVDHDGVVTVRAARMKRDLVIEIKDTGPGIPADVTSNIFDPYFTTRDSGTGLGLSEVHRIVTAHGGRISASNDNGAMFTIVLPGEEKE